MENKKSKVGGGGREKWVSCVFDMTNWQFDSIYGCPAASAASKQEDVRSFSPPPLGKSTAACSGESILRRVSVVVVVLVLVYSRRKMAPSKKKEPYCLLKFGSLTG